MVGWPEKWHWKFATDVPTPALLRQAQLIHEMALDLRERARVQRVFGKNTEQQHGAALRRRRSRQAATAQMATDEVSYLED